MKKKKLISLLLCAAALMMILSGCSATDPETSPTPLMSSPSPQTYMSASPTAGAAYRDGVYTAEASDEYAEKNHGWKEYVKLKVAGGQIADVEYDALQDGKKKSEIGKKEYPMEPHPSVWIPELNAQLKDAKSAEDIDGVTGATLSSRMVRQLYASVLSAASQQEALPPAP